jgi:hypothetical protein
MTDPVTGTHPIPSERPLGPEVCIFCGLEAVCQADGQFACSSCCDWCDKGYCTPIREAVE